MIRLGQNECEMPVRCPRREVREVIDCASEVRGKIWSLEIDMQVFSIQSFINPTNIDWILTP